MLEEGRGGRMDPSSNGTGDKITRKKGLDKQALSRIKHEY